MHPVRTILGKTTAAGLLIPAFWKRTGGYCRGEIRRSARWRLPRIPAVVSSTRAKVSKSYLCELASSPLRDRIHALPVRLCGCSKRQSQLGAPRGREATELVIAAGIAESLPLP